LSRVSEWGEMNVSQCRSTHLRLQLLHHVARDLGRIARNEVKLVVKPLAKACEWLLLNPFIRSVRVNTEGV
jgi:hypothetical protein